MARYRSQLLPLWWRGGECEVQSHGCVFVYRFGFKTLGVKLLLAILFQAHIPTDSTCRGKFKAVAPGDYTNKSCRAYRELGDGGSFYGFASPLQNGSFPKLGYPNIDPNIL